MDIKGQDYHVTYDQATATVTFAGELALMGMGEYPPIAEMLDQALNDLSGRSDAQLTLDLQTLKFLNSSGINVISKFVIKVRRSGNIAMVIKGSKIIPWQEKSLVNLKRLMPEMVLELA
jgi:hypothetical protein